MEQRIRFCTTSDGVRLAYAQHGSGPPLVWVANWLTHLEHDWRSPVWKHWLDELGRGRTVYRYDQRCCGLSDWEVETISVEAWISDLETVIDAAGLEEFDLLGISQGGPLAVAYAARHPERVRRIVIHSGYARGRSRRDSPEEVMEENRLLIETMRVGLAKPDPTFRRLFTNLFLPDATEDQRDWFDELARISATPDNVVRMAETWSSIEVSEDCGRVEQPTLITHPEDERVVPFEEGRLLASMIPNAEFVPLPGRNHILLADEPAWKVFAERLGEFLGQEASAQTAKEIELTRRERQVLELVAQGMSNEEIAARLVLSTRTVERHLSNIYTRSGLSGRGARAAAAARLVARDSQTSG